MRLPQVNGYGYLCGIRFSSSVTLWVDFVLIFTVLTFGFDASPKTLGYAAALYGLPSLLLGPLFGTLADHTSPLKFLIVSFSIRFIVACLLFGANSEAYFLAFVCLKGISNLGSGAAEIILTRKLLTNKDLVNNISLITIMDQFIKVCSPLAAGIIASMADKAHGFLISASFSLFGVFCVILLSLSCREKKIHNLEKRSFGSLEALKVLLRSGPSTQLFFICALIQSAVLGCYDSLLSIFLKDIGFEAYIFGVIVSSTALGGILAGLCFKLVYPSRISLCSTLSLLIFGLMVVIAGSLPKPESISTLSILILTFFFAGFAYGLTSLGFGVTLQKYCPLSNLGTVSATARSLTLLFMIVGPIFGAWLSTFISISGVFVLSGGIAVFFGALLHLKYRDNFSLEATRISNE
ncbi:MFS transporter [Pseudomonas brassicacearum]|uniref:MFS transporter n=1 Tax=Pseudomonas brassicacearum TaxID=930166 RepID=UPI000F4AED32|nr:MFS transporter [Pseudomonas brassicacearum]